MMVDYEIQFVKGIRMIKCDACGDAAMHNYSWVTSRGLQCANLCGYCGANFWDRFKNTPSGQTLITSHPKSIKEIEKCYKDYELLLNGDCCVA